MKKFSVILAIIATLLLSGCGRGGETEVSIQPVAAIATPAAVPDEPPIEIQKVIVPAPVQAPTPFVPAQLKVERLGIDIPVLARPFEADGSFPAPPQDDPAVDATNSAAWWQDGTRPNEAAGSSQIWVHTYAKQRAIGNRLDEAGGIHLGDTIELDDATGDLSAKYNVNEIRPVPAAADPPEDTYAMDRPNRLSLGFCRDKVGSVWKTRVYVIAERV